MSKGRFALSFAGFRRLVAMLCAFAFLTVGMAHALTECGGLGAGTQTIASNVLPDQPTGTSGHAVPCDHCYGCTGAVAPFASVMTGISSLKTDLVVLPVLALRAHAPDFQTPPPKSLT